jgi:hypothetical protein
MEKERFFYIYNRHQANFFIQGGLPVLEVGTGKDDGFYVKFLRNTDANKVFGKWIDMKEELQNIRNN